MALYGATFPMLIINHKKNRPAKKQDGTWTVYENLRLRL